MTGAEFRERDGAGEKNLERIGGLTETEQMSDSTVQLVQHQQDRHVEEGEREELSARKTRPYMECVNPKTTLRSGMDQRGLD